MAITIISKNAEGVTTGYPWRDVHKRVWRGNVLGVRSEGERVRGHSQLDSTQEEMRVRKRGEGVVQRLTD